ncbi:MAG: peptidase MA family metallohydrolase [Dehalococcoidales bacterium]|nr:peptidase MA family metallohydrolase [Dehalococcoidales bacterium]
MFKKFLLIAMVLCMAVLSIAPVQAESELRVLTSSAEVSYPQSVNFKISAQSDVNITEVRLQYSVESSGFAQVVSEAYLQITPSTKVDTQWDWDLVRIGGLPPGVTIRYQWLLKDASGTNLKTPFGEVEFDDSRFSWQTLTEGKVTIYWYSGTQSFAQELMQATQSALTRLSASTGASIKDPIRLYIYADSTDLKGSMIFPQEWTGGVAFTRYGCIAIGISSSNLDWGKRAIAHELTHLITAQMTLNPYNDIPTWLDEGLAMYNEGSMQATFTNNLALAIKENRLISVRSLCSPFSAYATISYVSYAESYSIVEYLISNYGKDKMSALLDTFHQGSTYDGALQKVYGFDMDDLNTMWQASLMTK